MSDGVSEWVTLGWTRLPGHVTDAHYAKPNHARR